MAGVDMVCPEEVGHAHLHIVNISMKTYRVQHKNW